MNDLIPLSGTPLYQVTDAYLAALHDLIAKQEAGELPEEVVKDTLEAMAGDVQVKSLNVAAYLQNMEAQAEAIDAAMARMKARSDTIKKATERLRQYLHDNMVRSGITEISCPQFTLKIVKNPPKAEIVDAQAIPPFYTKMPPPPEPQIDKAALLADLKKGEVPGARLVQGTRLKIS